MQIRYLLDTNIASYAIKGEFPRLRDKLAKVPISELGISVISEAELRFGVNRKPGSTRLKQAVDEFFLRVEILPWDSAAAQHYVELRGALEDARSPMANFDLMIAAQALAAGLILVTHDKVFHRIRQLKIEDWTKAA